MDANTLNSWILSLTTVVLFVCFIIIAVWAYGRDRQATFARAALLPLEDDGVEVNAADDRANSINSNEVQQ